MRRDFSPGGYAGLHAVVFGLKYYFCQPDLLSIAERAEPRQQCPVFRVCVKYLRVVRVEHHSATHVLVVVGFQDIKPDPMPGMGYGVGWPETAGAVVYP